MEEEPQSVAMSALETCAKATDAAPWTLKELVELFVCCLLSMGGKTQTHLNRLLSNYSEVFALLENGEKDSELPDLNQQTEGDANHLDIHPVVLQTIQKYWIHSQQKYGSYTLNAKASLHREQARNPWQRGSREARRMYTLEPPNCGLGFIV